jgi:hypothetical protein
MIAVMKKSLLITACSLVSPILVTQYLGDDTASQSVTLMVLSAILCCATWVAAVILLKHPLSDDPAFKRALCFILRNDKYSNKA